MAKTLRLMTLLILPAALVGLFSAIAMADAGAVATSTGGWPLVWLVPYTPILIPLLAGLQSVVVRGQTSAAGFWHSYWGHALLVLFGAIIGAGLHFLQAGAFTKQALLAALAGAASAYFGAWKTTGKTDASDGSVTSAPTPPLTRAAAVLLPLLFFTISSCSYCKVPANTTTPVCKVAQVAQQCGEPAVVQLVLQYLPQVVAALLSDNYGALLGDLIATLGADGKTVVTCAVQVADANTTPPPGSAAPAFLVTLHTHATAWLAAQKQAERPLKVSDILPLVRVQ